MTTIRKTIITAGTALILTIPAVLSAQSPPPPPPPPPPPATPVPWGSPIIYALALGGWMLFRQYNKSRNN